MKLRKSKKTASERIFTINRYNGRKNRKVKEFSGYEQIIQYSKAFIPQTGSLFLSKFILRVFRLKKPEDYLTKTIFEELRGVFNAWLFGSPIFYLYADKDAFLGPIIKRRLNLKNVKIFGTLHWPMEISQNYSFNKYKLHSEFDGIITLSSSLSFYLDKKVKFKIIPHGIDSEFWTNRNPSDYQNSYLIIGQSNRNHQKQIALIKSIKNWDSGARFDIVISNKQVKQLYRNIASVRVIENRLTDLELRDLYSQSKAVILIQDYCLASNTVMECMSMGIPLLANSVGDIKEYIGENYPLFLNQDNQEDLVGRFVKDKQLRNQVSKILLRRKLKYQWEEVTSKTIDFIMS